jgi:hypothetical protein
LIQTISEWVKRKTDHYGYRYLPVVTPWIRLNEHQKQLSFEFKIDSGAIVTAMNHSAAVLLGVNDSQWEKAERIDIKTAGGHKIWGRKFKAELVFGDIVLSDVNVFFSEQDEFEMPLLGRIDVFDYFDVNLQARNRKTVLTH